MAASELWWRLVITELLILYGMTCALTLPGHGPIEGTRQDRDSAAPTRATRFKSGVSAPSARRRRASEFEGVRRFTSAPFPLGSLPKTP